MFTLVVGNRVLPRGLGHIAKTGSRELFTLSVLVIALGPAPAPASITTGQ